MWICGPGQYGQLLIRPEYATATVGTPTDDYYLNQNVYRRDFTTGLALVNPSSTASYTVSLPPGPSWRDLYGNAQGPTVTLGPASALVLVRT
jgi:hypothetical protein